MDINLLENWSMLAAIAGIIGTYAVNSYRVSQLEKQINEVEEKSSNRRNKLEVTLDQIREAQNKRDKESIEIKSLIRELKSSIDGMIHMQNRENEFMREQINELKKN